MVLPVRVRLVAWSPLTAVPRLALKMLFVTEMVERKPTRPKPLLLRVELLTETELLLASMAQELLLLMVLPETFRLPPSVRRPIPGEPLVFAIWLSVRLVVPLEWRRP